MEWGQKPNFAQKKTPSHKKESYRGDIEAVSRGKTRSQYRFQQTKKIVCQNA